MSDLDGNDLLSYWPALEGCEAHSLQKWGSERRLGGDYSKDAANNNQQEAALTSGDESGLTHRQRKGTTHFIFIFLVCHSQTNSKLQFFYRNPKESSGLPTGSARSLRRGSRSQRNVLVQDLHAGSPGRPGRLLRPHVLRHRLAVPTRFPTLLPRTPGFACSTAAFP